MIVVRMFIDSIPDEWEPEIIWLLVGLETLVEVFVLSVAIYLFRMWIG